jgi:hypothetical protein
MMVLPEFKAPLEFLAEPIPDSYGAMRFVKYVKVEGNI